MQEDSRSTVLRLVLPELALRRAMHQAPAGSQTGVLAHGLLVLQVVDGKLLALVPRLALGPPQVALPGGAQHDDKAWPLPTALALVYAAPPGMAHPADGDRDAWVSRMAPLHRLACRAVNADLLLVWRGADGLTGAWLRTGDRWTALRQGALWSLPKNSVGHGQWQPVDDVLLPGARQQHLMLEAGREVPQAVPAWDADERYSRQALALSAPVLARLQQSRIGIVGCGIAGAGLASSLVRLGCSVLVVDPETTEAHDLMADLPPWMEGQPRVLALHRQIAGPRSGDQVDRSLFHGPGLLRDGAHLDVRQLPVQSPAAGMLLAGCDIVIATTPGASVLWTAAWAMATLKPFLAIGIRTRPTEAGGRLLLMPPGAQAGCPLCLRWLADAEFQPAEGEGALRSWSMMCGHVGWRMVERMVEGRIMGALERRLINGDDGSLSVQDRMLPMRDGVPDCPMCRLLPGAGLGPVAGLMTSLVQTAGH